LFYSGGGELTILLCALLLAVLKELELSVETSFLLDLFVLISVAADVSLVGCA